MFPKVSREELTGITDPCCNYYQYYIFVTEGSARKALVHGTRSPKKVQKRTK
jgi:hypothetical protein